MKYAPPAADATCGAAAAAAVGAWVRCATLPTIVVGCSAGRDGTTGARTGKAGACVTG